MPKETEELSPEDQKLLGGPEDDELAADPKAPEPAANEVAPPTADPAADPKDPKEQEEPAPAKAAKDDRSNWIPPHRLGEVTEERNREREAREKAEAELAALKAAKEPPAEAIDVNALEKEYTEAVFSGDSDKAVEIRTKVNAEIQRKAEEAAFTRTTREMTQRESNRAYADAYAKVLQDYPYLKPDTGNPEGQQAVLDHRDTLIGKGMRSSDALLAAAKLFAPQFAEKVADQDSGEKPDNVTPIDGRKASAVARGIKDAAAQPAPPTAGAGNRAVPAPPAPKTQKEYEALPEAEREKLLM